MHKIIDGKLIASEIKEELKVEVKQITAKNGFVTLAVIQVGEDKASSIYVNNKKKACEYIGIQSRSIHLQHEATQEVILEEIQKLNQDPTVHGILVQLPLPTHVSSEEILLAIDPRKDVDGFHPANVGLLYTGKEGFVSCTPAGILELIKRSNITIEGKECVVVGRSNIVGKPVAQLMLNENATVTITHSKTHNLKEVCKRADILIAALGSPKFITKEYIKEGACVIDVGIHRDNNNKLCGDVDFELVATTAGYITPVPGGVGPMTIAMLMKNCVKAAKDLSQLEDSNEM